MFILLILLREEFIYVDIKWEKVEYLGRFVNNYFFVRKKMTIFIVKKIHLIHL